VNGTSTGKKTSNGSASGSVTGEKSQVGDKNRERRRGTERKEGDRKEGDRPTRGPGGERRDRGGRERDPNSKVHTLEIHSIDYIPVRSECASALRTQYCYI
jgi:hypothetical protein